jgi:hypothetical protein
MPRAGRATAGLLLAFAVCGAARAEPISDADAAILRAGARMDADCLKRDKIKDIGDCRMAATGSKQPDLMMVGFTFHMWSSDVRLAELYRNRSGKAEIVALFEQLADAEFPVLYASERQFHLSVSDLCRITEVDCAAAHRHHDKWVQRLGH